MKVENLDDLIVQFGFVIEEAIDINLGLDDIQEAFQVAWEEAEEDIRERGVKPIQRATIKE